MMMNDVMLRSLGYTKDEVLGANYLETFVPQPDRGSLAGIFEKLVNLNQPTVNENRVLTKDGRELLVEWHGRPVFKENGTFDFFFGVGKGGAHIMAAFSRDLYHWTVDPEPLYKAGGNPSGLDKKYAHKISLVWNPASETYYMFYNAVGNKSRGIGLITSKPLVDRQQNKPDAGAAEN